MSQEYACVRSSFIDLYLSLSLDLIYSRFSAPGSGALPTINQIGP
jgi:hypothetical protein